MKKGIYAVAFPNLDEIDPTLRNERKISIESDMAEITFLIKNAEEKMCLQFSPENVSTIRLNGEKRTRINVIVVKITHNTLAT